MKISSSTSLSKIKLPVLPGGQQSENSPRELFNSTPMTRALVNTIAQRKTVLSHDLNQLAESVMLATASGANLDQVTALMGVKRLALEPADNEASPPIPAVLEEDARIRQRARYSVQSMNHAGCEGSYRFHALSANAHIKDVSVFSRDWDGLEQVIHIIVLSDYGHGDERDGGKEIIQEVRQAIEPIASITDTLKIQWANIIEYTVDAKLEFSPGANKGTVRNNVINNVQNLIHEKHRLGSNIVREEFLAAMYLSGIERVILDQPATDTAIALDSAAYNSGDIDDPSQFNIREAQQLHLEINERVHANVRSAHTLTLESKFPRPDKTEGANS